MTGITTCFREARNAAIISNNNITEITEKAGTSMDTKELVDTGPKLSPAERFALIDELLHSLDRPTPSWNRIWIEEAEFRLAAYRSGKVKGIPARM